MAKRPMVGRAMPAHPTCATVLLCGPIWATIQDSRNGPALRVASKGVLIAHVDMDAFYVSVELQRRPELNGQPVVVAGSGPRAVVTTASYEARKFGVFSATPAERARERFAQARPGLIPGIGPKTAERLQRQGIETLGALAATPDHQLTEWFGARLGPYLGSLARFEDDRAIETVRLAKSESRETTFDHDLRGLNELEPQLRRLTQQLCSTLTSQNARGRTIGIKVRYDDFSTVTRARSLPTAVNDEDTVWQVAVELLRR